MLHNIILINSCSGQLKKGVKYFPKYIKQFIKPKYNIISSEHSSNNIFFNSADSYSDLQNYKTSINIGGDHSITISTGAKSLNYYEDVKFIWIDAHPDINTYDKSSSKNFHGMPLAFLTGLDKSIKFPFIKKYLKMENIFYIGIRDIDCFEREIIDKYNIEYITTEKVNSNYEDVSNELKKFINNKPIHLSFDVDSLDPKYISTTGTMVKNGLDIIPAKYILDTILNEEHVVGLDIVEMNLDLDVKNRKKSLDNFRYLFSHIFN